MPPDPIGLVLIILAFLAALPFVALYALATARALWWIADKLGWI